MVSQKKPDEDLRRSLIAAGLTAESVELLLGRLGSTPADLFGRFVALGSDAQRLAELAQLDLDVVGRAVGVCRELLGSKAAVMAAEARERRRHPYSTGLLPPEDGDEEGSDG